MHDARKIVHQLNSMWNDKDATRIDKLYAREAEHEDITSGVKLQGVAAIRDLFTNGWEAMSDLRTDVKHIIAQGEWIAWEWTMSATHTGDFPDLPATGRPFLIEGASIIRVRDGKVLSQRDYYDQATFLRQIGAMPER